MFTPIGYGNQSDRKETHASNGINLSISTNEIDFSKTSTIRRKSEIKKSYMQHSDEVDAVFQKNENKMFKIVVVILSILFLSVAGTVCFIFLRAKKTDGEEDIIKRQDP